MTLIVFKQLSIKSKMLGLSIIMLFMTACGGDGWIKDAKVRTYTSNNNIYGEMTTFMNTGGILLPAITLPIINPQSLGASLGHLAIRPSLVAGMDAELAIGLNLTQIAGLSGNNKATLPNGSPLPIAGYNPQEVLMLSVGGGLSQVYVALNTDKEQAMFGAAIPIKEMDSLGLVAGGANIFPVFELDNGLRGSFGIFTGQGVGQNGFALFLDVSTMLNTGRVAPQLAAVQSQHIGVQSLPATYNPIEFFELTSSDSTTRRVDRKLYELSNSGKALTLH